MLVILLRHFCFKWQLCAKPNIFFMTYSMCQISFLQIIKTHTWYPLCPDESRSVHLCMSFYSSDLFFVPWPNFIKLLSTKMCLAWNFFLDKYRITNQFSICCILLVTVIFSCCSSWKSHGNLVSNPVVIKQKKFMVSNFVCLAALWNWAQVITILKT